MGLSISDIQEVLGKDFNAYMVPVTLRLREPMIKTAIRDINFSRGSAGLDAGCGIGLQSLWLAEAVGPDGRVTGLDISKRDLSFARDLMRRSPYADQIDFKEGDIHHTPFDDNSFDWAWSVDCVGYAPMEALPLIEELKRVVKPGGKIVLLAWSSETLLPGYPDLEAKLRGTTSGLAPFRKNSGPENHVLRTSGWFRKAGLMETRTRTFVGDVHAPLSEDDKAALGQLLEMRWYGLDDELSEDDTRLYRALCSPKSENFIVNHPDYYAFFTYSLFAATVP